jgi:hypothetical protein
MKNFHVRNLKTSDTKYFPANDLDTAINAASLFFFGELPVEVRRDKSDRLTLFRNSQNGDTIGTLIVLGIPAELEAIEPAPTPPALLSFKIAEIRLSAVADGAEFDWFGVPSEGDIPSRFDLRTDAHGSWELVALRPFVTDENPEALAMDMRGFEAVDVSGNEILNPYIFDIFMGLPHRRGIVWAIELNAEVSQTDETIVLTIRDHALTTPEADPMKLIRGTTANVIHCDKMLKET